MKYSREVDVPVIRDADEHRQIAEAESLGSFHHEGNGEKYPDEEREVRIVETESGSRVSSASVLFMLTAITAGLLAICWYVSFLETLTISFNR